MLAKALLPGRRRPVAVDALVVVTAGPHVPVQILTTDPGDLSLPGSHFGYQLARGRTVRQGV
jgi:hypothetical protein